MTIRTRKAVLLLSILIGFACGPDYGDEYLSFFVPESSDARADDHRYFFSLNLYNLNDLDYSYLEDEQTPAVIDANIRAWVAYAGGRIDTTTVSKAVYEGEAKALQTLENQLNSTHPEAVTYLQFARQTDRTGYSRWDEPERVAADSAQRPQWLATAKQAYETTSDPFLKERYGFQAVKLAAEMGDPEQVRHLYDQLIVPLTNKTLVSDYALCRRAGASLALSDTARAIFEFAQVFDRCPDRRAAAEHSLRQRGIRFREEALSFARTDAERAAVYAICALQPKQNALELLEKLVALQPKNPLVELVMAREINRNEYYFFTDNSSPYYETRADSSAFRERQKQAPTYADELRSFSNETAQNPAITNKAFWLTASAYLDYLHADLATAKTTLDKAAGQPNLSKPLQQQITLQQMLLLADQTEPITPAIESQLIGYLETFGKAQNFRLNNAFVKLCKAFADRYEGQKTEKSGGFLQSCRSQTETPADGPSLAKAYLLRLLTSGHDTDRGYFANMTDEQALNNAMGPDTLRQVALYVKQANPSDFDKRLIRLSELTNDQVNLLLGRRLMAHHRYAEAADVWAAVSPAVWQSEAFQNHFVSNPFDVNLNPKAPDESNWTPLSFARRMAELSKQAPDASGDKAADLYYQLGCGAWNLSWHGTAWLLTHAAWSSGEVPYSPNPADDYYTTAKAQAYFEQSNKAAKSPVIAARSAFLAARCEANRFDVRRAAEQQKAGYVADDDPAFIERMRALREKEFNTQFTNYVQKYDKGPFHQQMLEECGTYFYFLDSGGEQRPATE